jgi:nitroreductase
MDLYDVMRTTFSAREFTDDPVPDAVLYRIFENARFASSGGNRQGWHVIVVRDPAMKRAIGDCNIPAARLYMAQRAAGENPLNTIDPSSVDAEAVARRPAPPGLGDAPANAPVVLVVCVDLKVVASTDRDLPRVGVISGASIYPFVWNILLAARNEGYGGTLTTWAVAEEPELQRLLGIPPHVAVAAVIPFGRPVKQLTKLKRKPVAQFATLERYDGPALSSTEEARK